MAAPNMSQGRVRFGVFEADFALGELRKNGLRIRLQNQPLQVLRLLISRAGEVVSRTELREALWSTDTFVGFEHGLNNAMNRLREALGDVADNPRFIETVPRRGYRFIAILSAAPEPGPATLLPSGGVEAEALQTGQVIADSAAVPQRKQPVRAKGLAAAAAALLISVFLFGVDSRILGGRKSLNVSDPRIRSLAVLPLENLTGDPGQEYFADGLTDALITKLARFGSLRVISRTSAMRYKGARKPLREIGRELNVDGVIEGTVARSATRVRIDAQLVHTATERHLWADAYERELGDVLQLENEVASAIAVQVGAMVLVNPRKPAGTRPVNPEAYEAYLRGRYFWEKWSGEGFEKARAYFQQSINLDPRYAPAYVGLAEYYGAVALTNRVPRGDTVTKADENASKALRIDETIGLAHALLGIDALLFHCDAAGAERELNRALQLNPADPYVLNYHSYFLLKTGRVGDAIEEKRRVIESDPLSVIVNSELALYYMDAGRDDEAIRQLTRTLELDPNYAPTYARLGMAFVNKGQYDRAIAEYQKAQRLDETPYRVGVLGDLYVRSGRKAEAWQTIMQLKEMSKRRYVSPNIIAKTYARLGNQSQALVWLAKAHTEDEPPLSDPGFDTLRSDPRFHALEQRLKRSASCLTY